MGSWGGVEKNIRIRPLNLNITDELVGLNGL